MLLTLDQNKRDKKYKNTINLKDGILRAEYKNNINFMKPFYIKVIF